MQNSLQLRTSQTLGITPQLQHSLHLLQTPTLELQQEIEQLLAENPFLERIEEDQETDDPATVDHGEPSEITDSDAEQSPSDAQADTYCQLSDDCSDFSALDEHSDDWRSASANQDAPHNSDDFNGHNSTDGDYSETSLTTVWQDDNGSSQYPGGYEDENNARDYESSQPTLEQHLHQQALVLRLGQQDSAALYCLIESLNEDGYLEDSLGEIAQTLLQRSGTNTQDAQEALSELLHHFTVALRILQSFEPAGVGARNLAECLQLQLRAQLTATPHSKEAARLQIALALCQQPLEYLARRDVQSLQKFTGFTASDIQSAMQHIARLDPKPGQRFSQQTSSTLIPDVRVRRNTAHNAHLSPWIVELNTDIFPHLRVSEMYAKAIRRLGRGHEALQQHLQEARWVVKGLQQRASTILRVSQAIVERQQHFFANGVLAMQPLVLREIAATLNMHESTISRATTAKYMATPWGTFELKYFFSSGLQANSDGPPTSSTAVRVLLQQIIASESRTHPYSDTMLCKLLQDKGIQCARRTVAKYRDSLHIPPAHLRKRLCNVTS